MPKASRVLAALKRDGWVEVRRKGSHRTLMKGEETARWAFHDGREIGTTQMRQVARQFGYTLEALRDLL